jgi:hypothetical protein
MREVNKAALRVKGGVQVTGFSVKGKYVCRNNVV